MRPYKLIKYLSAAIVAAAVLIVSVVLPVLNVHAKNISENPAEAKMETNGSYSFGSVLQMRKCVPAENKASVLLKGYFYANDGGGGMFYWDAESTAEHDGGLVIAPNDVEKGRYIRICENDYRNVKWFGAVGSGSSNDTAAIKSAIASLPETGGTIRFPGGTYCVSETLQIGNGDGDRVRSDINGIKLIGCGAGFGIYGGKEPTMIKATKDIDSVISINGRISDVVIDGINIDAGNLAKNAITAKAVNSLRISNVSARMFTACGLYIIGGVGNGNGNDLCRFESVNAISVNDNVTCLYIDGGSENCITENCTFIDCRFDHHTTSGSRSGVIKNATGLSFYRCHFAGYNDKESDFLVLDSSVDGMPYGNTFYDCSILSIKVIESDGRTIGDNFFYGYGTYDNEVCPTHPRLHGITDSGLPFQIGGE